MKPPELAHAELILGICERFGKLPSEVEREPARLLGLLMIEGLGKRSADATG